MGLTVPTGKGIRNSDSNIQIIAWDVNFGGFVDAGAGFVRLNASKHLQSIGLGTSADMHLSDDELSMISARGSLSIYRNGHTANIVVHDISTLYTAEPDRIVFHQNFWTNAEMSTSDPISSAVAYQGVGQKHSQVHHLSNDFVPPVEGVPVITVPELVNIGMDIVLHWQADQLNGRTSHQYDWVGLFRKGECAQSTDTRLPDPNQPTAEHAFINQCFLQSESMRGHEGVNTAGEVRFGPESYSYQAGEYEVRYFMGESLSDQGYTCRSIPGTVEYAGQCLLYAHMTSSTITVVKAGRADSLDPSQLPGLEMYQDADDGAMYAHAF